MRVYGIFLGAVVPAVCAVYIGSDFRGSDIRAKVCKCSPSDGCFPTPADWQTFNSTLGGQLIKVTPLASPCFSSSNSFDPGACEYIRTNWNESTLHASDPASIMMPMWAGKGESTQGPCTPTGTHCEMGYYPDYTVNVTSPQHVVDAISFARKHKLRLAIKNTGHDFLGRNVGFGALGIWMHNLRGVEFHDNFMEEEGSAVTLMAGMQWGAAYEAVANKGLVVVGGANPTVGSVGGYLQGGGHGYLSSRHGLAVDNVLQFTAVTASGSLVTANKYSNPDLFFALRGGGGGTFAIVLSATLKTYPTPQTTRHTILVSSPASLAPHEGFWSAVAYIHGHLPRLADEGMAGYFVVVPLNGSLIMTWSFFIYERPPGTATALFSPIQSHINAIYPSLHVSSTEKQFATWQEAYGPNVYPEPVGGNSLLASRFLPRTALENNFENIRSALVTGFPKAGYGGIVGQLVLAGQVSRNRHLPTAVHPAWRSAYLHLIITVTWPDDIPISSVLEIRRFNSEVSEGALDRLALAAGGNDGVGAYFNEADAYTKREDAGRLFWGTRYDDLKVLKERWDPEGVFWCHLCIGNEMWAVQEECGRLCVA